ncbi:nucleoside recognition domain-containing protein [Oceanobacillus sp. 1P07AA]|uniref:nucleoside recognition domain-containing protein n=1 Tax=Oceanobacillus sp. 1P07AA TaxID=3132293 RepID=UPI0039A74845
MSANSKQTFALVGLESVGKSAIFRQLTGNQAGVETNIKGSTVVLTAGFIKEAPTIQIVDTPGIRYEDDSYTTKMTLEQTEDLDQLILVVKGSRLKEELQLLEDQLNLRGKNITVIATHKDKYHPTEKEKQFIRGLLNVPVNWCNSRLLDSVDLKDILESFSLSSEWKLNRHILEFLPSEKESKRDNWFEALMVHRCFGPLISIVLMICMFAFPVFLAYLFSSYFEPITENIIIAPLENIFMNYSDWTQELFIGQYGVLTLGWFSFLWAFPVVILMGISTSITEETGIQEHITHALDPYLRKIGLTGRDLIPVLTGFGCNVVAVMQSRSCSSCTRGACISMISFGSACSYQIGASLSLFGAAGYPLLFVPYILVLFFVGALHTRLWQKNDAPSAMVSSLPYLQRMTWRGTVFRVKTIVKQFLLQAMPIFILICLIASALNYFDVIDILSVGIAPLLGIFSLPAEVAPGVVFSIFRKDGMMILNEGQGSLLQSIEVWQLFIVVYLASTISSCLVTLYSITKELGYKYALSTFSKQFITSIVSTFILSMILYAIYN